MMSVHGCRVGPLIISGALALPVAPAFSKEFGGDLITASDRAFALYEAGEFKEASAHLRPLAERGNVLAQLYLATLYRTGAGVDVDEYEAAKWYAKAADSGAAEAQFHLGVMYLEGSGVTENSDQALEWISRAAAQGFGDAMDVFRYMLNNDQVLDC